MSTDFNLIAKDIQRKYRRRVQKSWWERLSKPEKGINPYTGLPVSYEILMLQEEDNIEYVSVKPNQQQYFIYNFPLS